MVPDLVWPSLTVFHTACWSPDNESIARSSLINPELEVVGCTLLAIRIDSSSHISFDGRIVWWTIDVAKVVAFSSNWKSGSVVSALGIEAAWIVAPSSRSTWASTAPSPNPWSEWSVTGNLWSRCLSGTSTIFALERCSLFHGGNKQDEKDYKC